MKNGANAANAKPAMSNVASRPRRWPGSGRRQRRGKSKRRSWIGTPPSNRDSAAEGVRNIALGAGLGPAVTSETHQNLPHMANSNPPPGRAF